MIIEGYITDRDFLGYTQSGNAKWLFVIAEKDTNKAYLFRNKPGCSYEYIVTNAHNSGKLVIVELGMNKKCTHKELIIAGEI